MSRLKHWLLIARIRVALWLIGNRSVIHGFTFYGVPVSSVIRDANGRVIAEARMPPIITDNWVLPDNDPSKRAEYERTIRELLRA